MNSYFAKTLFGFSSMMGVYGFSRGYRSLDHNGREPLSMDKVTHGFLNGLLYTAPIFNIIYVSRLINRIEIEYLDLNRDNYKSEYREIVGDCMDTI